MTELNVALIGHKFMGKAHSNAYRQVRRFFPGKLSFRMKVLCGKASTEELEATAREYGWEESDCEWERVIQRKDINVVDISTPGYLHHPMVLAAAATGKHIICEKPLANTVTQAMHPGFVVYSPETLLKLRAAAGHNLGCNFDPSHMFWQGIDPCAAIRALGDAVFHVHAKDTRMYETNYRVNGVLDTKPYRDEKNRSWIFRTVGYGHGADFWGDMISTLQMVGYDDVLSIEHEDSLMSIDEGLTKAAAFLNQIVIKEKLKEMWWA